MENLQVFDKTSEGDLVTSAPKLPIHFQNNETRKSGDVKTKAIGIVKDYKATISPNCQSSHDLTQSISYLLENPEKRIRLLALSALPLTNEGFKELSNALLYDPEVDVRKVAVEKLTESDEVDKDKLIDLLEVSLQTETDPEIISNALDYYYHSANENSVNATTHLLSRNNLSLDALESVAKFLIDAEIADSSDVEYYLTGSPSFSELEVSTKQTVLEDIMKLEQ